MFRSSCRQLSVYHIDNLSQASSVTEINIAPGILIPYFDEDTNIVFLGAKVITSDIILHKYMSIIC